MNNDRQTPLVENVKQKITSYWWMPLVRGILLLILGAIMFVQPGSTVLSLIWLLGFYWIVDGAFSIMEGLGGYTEKSRTWMIIGGIFGILAGFIIVGNPVVTRFISGTFIAWMIGIVVVANGLVMIFKGRDGKWTWWGLCMGILYVLFGIFVVSHPLITVGALVWVFASWALISGITAIVLAFRLRKLTKG